MKGSPMYRNFGIGSPMNKNGDTDPKKDGEEAHKTMDDAQKSFDATYKHYTGMLDHGDTSDFGHQKIQSTRADLIKKEKALKTAKKDYENTHRNPDATFYD